MQTAKNLTPKAKEIIRQAGIDIGKRDALILSKLPTEQQAEAAHLYASGQIDSISDYTPGRPRKRDTPPVPALPILTGSEPETVWKPYSIPPAQRGKLTTAETIAQLKSHNEN